MDREDGNKEVYALGNSESVADSNALKAAELTCKEAGQNGAYVTLHRDVAYKGAFGSAHEQRMMTDLLNVAGAVMGGPINRSGSTSKSRTHHSGSTTKTATQSASYSMNVDPEKTAYDLQKDSFESHLIFRCKQSGRCPPP